MGWNFGGAVIDFDFRSVVETDLDPELRRMRFDEETPEERLSRQTTDAGTLALAELAIRASSADAPVAFDDATSRYFDDYAVGVVGGKTVILGRGLGLYQDAAKSVEACNRVSRTRGAVLAFWFDDTSGSYMFSVFRDGARVRFRSRGEGLHDDEGAPVPGEPDEPQGPHDHQLTLLDATVGRHFLCMDDIAFERFSAG